MNEQYKLVKIKGQLISILRMSDGSFIPFDTNNKDYEEYLKWLEEGNEPLPADEEQQ